MTASEKAMKGKILWNCGECRKLYQEKAYLDDATINLKEEQAIALLTPRDCISHRDAKPVNQD